MRKAWMVLVLALLMSVGLRTGAQGGSLAQIIDSRSELATLQVFLDAADPSVRETLSSGGSYTLFAPTNTAFQNLASALDIPLAELLQNPQAVTQIMQYHVVGTRYSASQLRQLDGQVIPTTLDGAFVGIRLSDDDEITVNNVVEVTTPDINGSNGVVHVINDVLLNRVIASTIENDNLQDIITPNPGIQLSPTPAPTATNTPAASSAIANLRVAHLAPDAPPVDIYINDEAVLEGIAFPQVSSFVTVRPGTYRVTVTPAGAPAAEAVIGPANITLADGTFATLAAIGSLADDTLQGDVITEDYRPLEDDSSRILFYHAIEGAPPITITDAADDDAGESLAEELAYSNSVTVTVPRGVYNLRVITADDDETTLLERDGLSLPDGSYQFIAAVGTPDEPQLLVESVRGSRADVLRQGSEVDAAPDVANAEGQIVELLQARDDDFSILLEALDVADDDLLTRLTSARVDPLTLLAPTDQAFRNLFATVGITQADLFANPSLLTSILQYHLVEGAFTVQDLRAANGTSIGTNLDNAAFLVSVNDAGEVRLNRIVEFIETDIRASNGIIHVIDEVLLPTVALTAFSQ